MIFDNNIHKTEVMTHNITPPHPKSKDQDVVKTRAGRRCFIPFAPIGLTTPSGVVSISSVNGLLWSLLKWMIVSVNRAKEAKNRKVIS